MDLAVHDANEVEFEQMMLVLHQQKFLKTLSVDRSPVMLRNGRSERLGLQLDVNTGIGYFSARNMRWNEALLPDKGYFVRAEFLQKAKEDCAICKLRVGPVCGCDYEPRYADGMVCLLRSAARMESLVHLDVRLNTLSLEDMRVLHRIVRQGQTLTTLGFSVSPTHAEAGRQLVSDALYASNLRSVDLHAYNGFRYENALRHCYARTDRITLSGYVDATAQRGLMVSILGAGQAKADRFTYLGVTAYISEEPLTNLFKAVAGNRNASLSCLFYEKSRRDAGVALRDIPSIYSVVLPETEMRVSERKDIEPGRGNFSYPHSDTLRESMGNATYQYVTFKQNQ